MEFKATRYSKTLSILESIVYYTTVILTLGSAWALKTIIKKAINEAKQDK